MNEKLSLRESICCRILLLVARILSKDAPQEIKDELKNLDGRLYVATI